MKLMINMTTSMHDLERFRDNQDLKQFYRGHGLDGIELYEGGKDEAGLFATDDTIGVHLRYFHDWLGLWRGDTKAVIEEFGTKEMVEMIFGGFSRDAMIETMRKNLRFARRYSPEYVVFHVSNVTIDQCITRKARYADEEVIEAALEVLNALFRDSNDDFILLMENLWWTGLKMDKPELTLRLLEGVEYPRKGIVLDLGHLLHTNTALRTLDEGIDYIHRILDLYDDLGFIRGIHLNQTLSGEYAESIIRNPFKVEGSYYDKILALQEHVFKIDNHKPFLSKRIGTVLNRINPEYLVLEFISSDREELSRFITEQRKFLA
ncbi:MAG: sugar phosphate isomerase/epimerase [Treponema sp.]|jgi:sugar phosphate isomerase/epimerase|nr:sugar phosphate isomerase/epimerase [Treponema sp.]